MDDQYFTTVYMPRSCTGLPSTTRVNYGSDSKYYYDGDGNTVGSSLALFNMSAECNMPCTIEASEVRLIYWPIDTKAKNATSGSTTTNTPSTPTGFISNGFTLSVRTQRQITAS